jgi:subtilisin family serine protease
LVKRTLVSFAIAAMSAGMLATIPSAAASGQESYIVVYGSSSQVHQDQVRATGAEVKADLSKAGLLAVKTSHPDALKALSGVRGVAKDRVRFQVPKEQVIAFEQGPSEGEPCAGTQASCPLQWDLARIHVPQAWNQTMGSANVKVAVIDTGVTSTHVEVGSNYNAGESKSFVAPNSICRQDATTYNSIEDFHGHGTWTATHVAGVNGTRMTGIAPKSTLVNIRVLGACGFGFDSWVLSGMVYGNQIGAKVESMSLGGYLCAHGIIEGSVYCGTAELVGDDPVIWQAYQNVGNYLINHGTLVVAAAGNDHVRLNASGTVVTHGSLGGAPIYDPYNDLFGLTEVPGGAPGVIAVGALNRITAEGADGETVFGQFGVGRKDQLTYYSSYGERIDVSAPGGARNYNVPRLDCDPTISNCLRLGPSGPGMTDNPGDFGAWGTKVVGTAIVPCDICYAYVQGTSMATPQVAGVAVLALSVNANLSSRDLARLLRRSVTSFTDPNATPPMALDDSFPTWNWSLAYGEPGIPNSLMGRGVIDAAKAVGAGNKSNNNR